MSIQYSKTVIQTQMLCTGRENLQFSVLNRDRTTCKILERLLIMDFFFIIAIFFIVFEAVSIVLAFKIF